MKRNIRRYRKIAEENLEQKCCECEKTNNLVVHHIDGVCTNDALENLQIMCRACHTSLHTTGFKHTEEAKKKITESQLGEKHHYFGKRLSEEHKRKLSEAHKGVKLGEKTKMRMSEARKGVKLSNEHRRKLSEAKKGVKQKEVECPHCKKKGGISNMKRYHFDNCKLRSGVNE